MFGHGGGSGRDLPLFEGFGLPHFIHLEEDVVVVHMDVEIVPSEVEMDTILLEEVAKARLDTVVEVVHLEEVTIHHLEGKLTSKSNRGTTAASMLATSLKGMTATISIWRRKVCVW